MNPWIRLLAVALSLVAAPAFAQLRLGASADELLQPEKAFQFSARALDAKTIEVDFAIADGYYMYRDKFRFTLDGPPGAKLGVPEMPAGIRKKDEFFGEIETYRKQVSIRIPVEAAAARTLQLTVRSQGCADLGVCYVPMDSKATIRLAALAGATAVLPE
jgi:thiol:disulfide interchange protein DsbD